MSKHFYHVTLGPFVPEAMVTVAALGNLPFVKRLNHHHKAHLVTKLYKLRIGHVMGSAHRIAAHLLQHLKLMTQSISIDCGTEWTKVMMVTYSLKLAMMAV